MKESKTLKAYLSVLVLVAFIGLIFQLLFIKVPGENNDLVMFLFGCLTAIVKDVYGYYFGSSEGSTRKSEVMEKKYEAS